MTIKEAIKDFVQAAPLSYTGAVFADAAPPKAADTHLVVADAGTWANPVSTGGPIFPRFLLRFQGTDRAATHLVAHSAYKEFDHRKFGGLQLNPTIHVCYSKVDQPPQFVGSEVAGEFAFALFVDLSIDRHQEI